MEASVEVVVLDGYGVLHGLPALVPDEAAVLECDGGSPPRWFRHWVERETETMPWGFRVRVHGPAYGQLLGALERLAEPEIAMRLRVVGPGGTLLEWWNAFSDTPVRVVAALGERMVAQRLASTV